MFINILTYLIMYQTIQVYIRSQSTLELKWVNKVYSTKVNYYLHAYMIVLVKNLLVQWELCGILLKYTTDNH